MARPLTEQEENELLRMTVLTIKDSGLPANLFLYDSIYAPGGSVPRIEIQRNRDRVVDYVNRIPMSISNNPRILVYDKIHKHDLDDQDIEEIKAFVRLNSSILLRLCYQNDDYDNVDFLRDMVLL